MRFDDAKERLAPSQTATTAVLVNDKPIRIHPIVGQLADPAVRKKMKVRSGRELASEIWDIDMVDRVWISEVMSNNKLGDKVGLRQKWFGEPWEAPFVNHVVPDTSEKVTAAMFRQYGGHTLTREDMPEASAVYDMSRFRRMKDVFFIGGFLAVKGRIAEVLSKLDFGAGGGLVLQNIYEADETTSLPGPFYILNFRPMKDCFPPDASTNIGRPSVHHQTGRIRWSLSYLKDGDIAVSPAALGGQICGCARASRAASS